MTDRPLRPIGPIGRVGRVLDRLSVVSSSALAQVVIPICALMYSALEIAGYDYKPTTADLYWVAMLVVWALRGRSR